LSPRWPPPWGLISSGLSPLEQRPFDPAVAVTVAELSAAQFQAVKSQLRGIGIEGLVVARRSGREIRAGRRTATL
jgi:hypothetical protein